MAEVDQVAKESEAGQRSRKGVTPDRVIGGGDTLAVGDFRDAGRHVFIPRRAYGVLLRRHVTVEETVIEPGRRSLCGPPHAGCAPSVVLLGRWGATSSKEPDDWITELEHDIAGGAALTRWFPMVGPVSCAAGALLVAIGIGLG